MAPERDRTPIFWRLVRFGLLQMLRRSLRQSLLGREITLNGRPTRVFAVDLRALSRRIEPEARKLRPLAEFHRLELTGNRLMVELAVYTAAFYRVLLDFGLSRAEARQLVADTGWRVYARLLGIVSLPVRLATRDPGRRLRWTIGILLRFPFGAPGAPGYAVTPGYSGDDIQTHFTHCPPHSFIRRLIAAGDRGELAAFRASWCRYDWPGADLIAGDGMRGHYTRPRTLSDGDDLCDMCWRARAPATKRQTATRRQRAKQGKTGWKDNA